MNPAAFAYHRVGSVSEAVGLLAQYDDDGAKLIAGGHSLLPVMKLRLAEPGHLIDLAGASDDILRAITRDGDTVAVGALVTHRTIERDTTIGETIPLLQEMARHVGDRQVRARGTLGGTAAHADPAADYPAGLLVLDATIIAEGSDGTREIPISEFFLGLLTTALSPDEIITAIHFPVTAPGTGISYQKVANQASGYAVVGVATQVTVASDGTAPDVRVGITGASDIAFRAQAVEQALTGKALDEAAITAALAELPNDIDFLDDLSASGAYRKRLMSGLTKRALLEAVSRASRA